MSIAAMKRILRDVLARIAEEDRKPTPPLGTPSDPFRRMAPHRHAMPYAEPPPRPQYWPDDVAAMNGRERARRGKRDERLFPIGFYASKVPPGAETDIEVKPQVLFRGERLAIPTDIATSFDVVDVKVGKDTQRVTNGDIPGAAFDTTATDARMEMDACEPGIVITLRVANRDQTNARDFKAVMYGTVYE